MKFTILLAIMILAIPALAMMAAHAGAPAKLLPELRSYLAKRESEFAQIESERREKLDAIAAAISERLKAGKRPRLTVVCTHNSRRSHMGQLWAVAGAAYYGFDVSGYSGGTDSTAFNPRAVGAVSRSGFKVEKTTEDENPIYHVRFAEDRPALTCFSKKYDTAPNPKSEFIAIMVCNEADAACPTVAGADHRFAIPFQDPKASDGTPEEQATYDARCAQIAREMLYVMSKVQR